MNKPLKFYVVPTPIGNLSDITYRAVEVLKSVDRILCEDTRTTKKLLDHYAIETPTESYHAHSSAFKEEKILEFIESGVTYALVSDAGTPTISDPGVKIIHEIHKRFNGSVDVVALPGATALITALSSSGFMGNQFTFYGFLPHKKGRASLISEMLQSKNISLFYESPHRIIKTLKYLATEYSDSSKRIYIARELTKIYEQKFQGSFLEAYEYFSQNPEKVRGEFVVVIDR